MKKNNNSEFVDKDYLSELFDEDQETNNEEPQVVEEEEPTEEETPAPSQEDDNIFEDTTIPLKEVITNLVKNNVWSDVSINYKDQEYNSLQELVEKETPTRELFEELLEVQKELKEKELKESYIKIDDKDQVRAKIAKAVLSGQGYEELTEKNNEREFLRDFDLTNRDNAINMIALYYRDKKNFDIENDPDHIAVLRQKINTLEKNGEIIEVAEQLRNELVSEYERDIENRIQAEKEKVEAFKEQKKRERKEFKEYLKSQNFSDSFIKQADDLRTNGYQEVLEEKLNSDKEFAKDFYYFLINPEEFIKNKSQKKVYENTKKMITLTGKKASSGRPTKETEEELPDSLKHLFE